MMTSVNLLKNNLSHPFFKYLLCQFDFCIKVLTTNNYRAKTKIDFLSIVFFLKNQTFNYNNKIKLIFNKN